MEHQRLEGLYIFLMEQAVKRYHQLASQSLRQHKAGITVDQWIVLKQISENNGSSQSDVAESTVKDSPTTARIIDQLLQKKLIHKQLDASDRRKYRVYTTPAGDDLIERLLPIVIAYRRIPVRGFSRDEMENLIAVIQRMLVNMQ